MMARKHRTLLLILPLFFCFFLAGKADAATLYLQPSQTQVSVGNIVSVQALVNTNGQIINNAESIIQYPRDLLEVISLDKTSIFSLWVDEPNFSNNIGQISFNGGVPNPGYQGTNGKIISVIFRAKKAGTASVVFLNSAVRANDGLGTDILTAKNGAEIRIIQAPAEAQPTGPASSSDLLAKIVSSSHPDQTKWYTNVHAVFDWTNAQGVTAVRLGYDTNAAGKPSVLYNDPISHKEIDLGDGIWYFHVQEKDASGWGPVATYRIQIDTTPPVPVVIEYPNGATTATSTIAVSFATTDVLSGIDHYQLAVDGKNFGVSSAEGSGVYALPSGDNGTHTLTVTAYDKAGNTVSAEQQFMTVGIMKPSAPVWSSIAWLVANYLSLFILIVVAIAAVAYLIWYFTHRFHIFRRRILTKEDRMHIFIHRKFNDLKQAVSDEIAALEEIRSKRKLTIEEERLVSRLSKLIDESESAIDKELDTVLKK